MSVLQLKAEIRSRGNVKLSSQLKVRLRRDDKKRETSSKDEPSSPKHLLPTTPAKKKNTDENTEDDAIDLDVDRTREEAGTGGRVWDFRQEMRKKTEAEDRNTNTLKARVQAVAASNKARSTIPMLGKGSKTRQGRGSWSDPSKRSTGIHLVIQPQPAGPGWIFWRWQILIVTVLSSKCKLIGLPIGKSTAQIAPIFN